MKVLYVHNRYLQRGGEDVVVDSEIALLKKHNIEVLAFFRDNKDIDKQSKIRTALGTIWSGRSYSDIIRIIKTEKPDIIHIHNFFPLISPSVFWAARRHKIPVIQTLHNYRLLCPNALFLRNGKTCEKCLSGNLIHGLFYRCYHNSFSQTFTIVSMLVFHRIIGTYRKAVSGIITLHPFCRNKFLQGGLTAEKLKVKFNFIDDPYKQKKKEHKERIGYVFVGRLSAEKGINVLAQTAMKLPNVRFCVIGTGPEAYRLENIDNIEMLGQLLKDNVMEFIRSAKALIFPSICYESFSLVILEAFACGTPIIASRIGAVSEQIEDGKTGLLFTPNDSDELVGKILWIESHPVEVDKMQYSARKEYEEKYSPEVNYRELMKIYGDLIEK